MDLIAGNKAAAKQLVAVGRLYCTFDVSARDRGLCPHVKNRPLVRADAFYTSAFFFGSISLTIIAPITSAAPKSAGTLIGSRRSVTERITATTGSR